MIKSASSVNFHGRRSNYGISTGISDIKLSIRLWIKNNYAFFGIVVWILLVIGIILRHLSGHKVRQSHSAIHSDLDFIYSPSMMEQQLERLSTNQRARYNLIQTGQLSKIDVEIVISRYREEITWSDSYRSLRTIYDKSDQGVSSLSIISGTTHSNGSTTIPLPNIGREGHTILTHIVNNYHRLAKLTVFTQGSPPTRGYRSENAVEGRGHLLANSTIHDYVLSTSEKGHFIFTAAVWLPSLAQRIRRGYNLASISRQQALSACPSPPLDSLQGTEYKFELDEEPSGLLEHIAKRCEADAGFKRSSESTVNNASCSGLGFWDRFVNLPRPPSNVAFFSQGSLFAVTRDQIHRRPLEQYQNLLNIVSSSQDPAAGYFLEYMWYYILTSDNSPCPTTGKEFDWASSEPTNMQDIRDRFEWVRSHPLSKSALKAKLRLRKRFN